MKVFSLQIKMFRSNGQDIDVMPFLIHAYATSDMPDLEGIYKEENGNYSHRVANYIGQERETGVEKYQMISEQYDASGTYYVRARYLHQGKSVDPSKISEYVKKTVVGSYKTAAEVTGEDITNQLFGGGHLTDLSKGIVTLWIRTIGYSICPSGPSPMMRKRFYRLPRHPFRKILILGSRALENWIARDNIRHMMLMSCPTATTAITTTAIKQYSF